MAKRYKSSIVVCGSSSIPARVKVEDHDAAAAFCSARAFSYWTIELSLTYLHRIEKPRTDPTSAKRALRRN